jgi:cytochrome c-type biogenesis protein CcmF
VILGVRDPFAVAAVVPAVLIAYVTGREFYLAARALRTSRRAESGAAPLWPLALLSLLDRDPRRYGGYVVHLALAIMAVAVVASYMYQQQVRVTVAPGETFEFAGYTFAYDGLRERRGTANGIETELFAPLEVTRNGEVIGVLEPGRRIFRNFPDQPSAIVGLHTSLQRDLYSFVEGWDAEQRVRVQVIVNPLVAWLWIGAALYATGGLIAFSPARAAAPAPREVVAPAVSTAPGA